MDANWEKQCYGCSEEDLKRQFKQRAKWVSTSDCSSVKEQVVFSMLSDVQEMIELGMKEQARQTLNRAKFYLGSKMEG